MLDGLQENSQWVGASVFQLMIDPQLRRRPVPQSTIQSDIFPSIPEQNPQHQGTVHANMMNSPASQSTLQSDIFPHIPENELYRRDTVHANIPNPSAIPQLSNPISIPQQSQQGRFTPEPLRSSPEPIQSILNEISDNPDDPETLAKVAEFLQRHDRFKRVSEYINSTPSIYSAVPSQAYTAASPSLSPRDHGFPNHVRRDSADSYETAARRREPQDPYQARYHRNDTYDSYTSTARSHTVRQDSNGHVPSFVQLERMSPPHSPPLVGPRTNNNLIRTLLTILANGRIIR
jgi:hypothetical protein